MLALRQGLSQWTLRDFELTEEGFSFLFVCPCGRTHPEHFAMPQVYAEPRPGFDDAKLKFCALMVDQELQCHVDEWMKCR